MEEENSVDIYADLTDEKIDTDVQSLDICTTKKPAAVDNVDDASKLTTFDLYDDLITNEGLQHQSSLKELSDKYEAALNTIGDLERQLEVTKKQQTFYSEKCQTLEKNISLLYITAKAELGRKDTQIEEFRTELKSRNSRWRTNCNKFQTADDLTEDKIHTRSNGHSAKVKSSVDDKLMKDKHRKESKTSPRKRKLVSSWEDLKDDSKKRLKRDESASSKGILLHCEKSMDGLISARKLVEKSKKDLRNRKSSELKRSSRDHSVSVIEEDLPDKSSSKVISKREQSSVNATKQCSNSGKQKDNKENIYHSKSCPSFEGLIKNHKEMGSPKEKSVLERVCTTSELSSSRISQSTSETSDRRTEKYPCRAKTERSRSEKEKERKYPEKKLSSKSRRSSKEDLERKEKYNKKPCSVVSKIDERQSYRHSERDPQKNSGSRIDLTRQGHTDSNAKDTDLRYKLQRKNRHGSNNRKHDLLPDKEIKEGHIEQENSKSIKRFKPDQIKFDEEKASVRNSLSPKREKSRVERKSDDVSNTNTSIEGVWSDFIAESSKHHPETYSNNDFQNTSKGKEFESRNCDADDVRLGTLCNGKRLLTPKQKSEKKPLTPHQSSVQSGKTEVSAITGLEEAMVRVNEEKFSKYAEASNTEKGALSNIGNHISKTDDIKELEGNAASNLLSKEHKKCSKEKHERSQKCPNPALCIAKDNDPSNVFIEELISMDCKDEDLFPNAQDNEIIATSDNVSYPVHVTEDGIKDCGDYKVKVPDAQENSLSCFDIKIHVSEKEMDDLLGCESIPSDRIKPAHLSKRKTEIPKVQKEVSSRTKPQSCNIESFNKKNEKESDDARKNLSKEMKQKNEALKSKPVLKLPLSTEQVFSESIVFKETNKPKSFSESVYVSVKGTKIVLKSEALRAEDKKPGPRNSLSKKEYDADREFLNQLKTKYSKEQLKNCQKQKLEIKDCQVSHVQDDKTKKSPEKHIPSIDEKKGHQDDYKDKSVPSCALDHKGLLQDTKSCDYCETEITNSSDQSDNIASSVHKSSSEDFGTVKLQTSTPNKDEDQLKDSGSKVEIIEIGVDNVKGHMMDRMLEENRTSVKENVDCFSQEDFNSSERSSFINSGNGSQMLEEPMEIARSTSPVHLASQCSSVSIDFIRNSIMKKIKEKETVPEHNPSSMNSSSVKEQTNFEHMDAINETLPLPVEDMPKFKTCLPSKPVQEEHVQSPTKFAAPVDELSKGNVHVCREVHTETECITEFFDEESQLDISYTVSLRAKDGISVRKQSFSKVSDVEETDENMCLVAGSGMEFEDEVIETESDLKSTLQLSESEEGEIHSSDSENDHRKDGNKKTKGKNLRDSRCKSEKESSNRNNRSSKHKSSSSSMTKERKGKEVDRFRKKYPQTEKSVKPRSSRIDSERKHEVKEDKKDRDLSKSKSPVRCSSRDKRDRDCLSKSKSPVRCSSRDKRDRDCLSKSKSPVRCSSRDDRNVERKRIDDSKQTVSHRHSSTNRSSEDRDRRSTSSSERHGRSHRDSKDANVDRHSQLRCDNSDRKADRHTSTRYDSTVTKSTPRDSNRTRDSRRKSFTRN